MIWRRGTHRHVKVKAEPQIEKPSRSIALRDRLASPWLVVGQYVFNVIIVLFVLWLTGNQAELQQAQQQYSDYLNGTGEQRDAERDAAKKEAEERAERSRQVLCELIAALEADIGGELQRISDAAGCDDSQGPMQPSSSGETPGSLPGETSQLGPIVSGGGTSTGSPTPGSGSATGDRAGGGGGRESSPATGGGGGGEGTPSAPGGNEEPPPSSDDDRGGLVDGIDLCTPLGCIL